MKAIIVGGGIGGLTTAIGLQQCGIDVKVFEAASELRGVGAGLWVAPNAMTVYAKLGISEDIRVMGREYKKGVAIQSYDGTVLGKIRGEILHEKYGYYITSIHRAKLHEVLLNHTKSIALGKRFERYEASEEKVTVFFTDGTSEEGDILIGADGIKSAVRQQMVGDVSYRYGGQTCWRLMTEYPLDSSFDMIEMWGHKAGVRVGMGKVSEDTVYTFITDKVPQGGKDNKETIKDELLELCKEYPSHVRDVIQATPVECILRNDIYDYKPLSQWYEGRVVLVGDSIHATTPNLGQGACQAIESAYALSRCLDTEESFEAAFVKYQSSRMKKAHHVTNTSWQLGQMVNIKSAVGRWFRNTAMRMTPASVTLRMQDRLYSVTEP